MTIKQNPYTKTVWFDQIKDVVSGEVIQVGTRFNQSRANNIENGIYSAHDYIIALESTVKRLQAQLEIDGRVPGNNGAFFDTFDGTPSRLALLTAKSDVTSNITAGSKTIPVSDVSVFEAMSHVTLYDGEYFEHVTIASVDSVANTITLASGVVGNYGKGAKIARSTATINTETQTMDVAPFEVYNVQLVEVV